MHKGLFSYIYTKPMQVNRSLKWKKRAHTFQMCLAYSTEVLRYTDNCVLG